MWYCGLLKHYIASGIVSIIGLWNYLWIWHCKKLCNNFIYKHEIIMVLFNYYFGFLLLWLLGYEIICEFDIVKSYVITVIYKHEIIMVLFNY